jgi:rhodanese-related sulfurtransferase
MLRQILSTVIMVLMFISCQAQQNKTIELANKLEKEIVFREIDVAGAKMMVKMNPRENVFLDVRTPEEVAGGKIPNAINIDFNAPDFRLKVDKLDKSINYIIYCHAGGRSTKAMEIMKTMGFINLTNMSEGYRAWVH